MRSIVLTAAVLTAVSLTACSGGPDSNEQASSKLTPEESNTATFCETYCEKFNACDSSSDVQTCSESCEETISQTLDKVRTDVIGEIKACWNGSDCRQVLSGDRLAECVDEAAVSVAPTAAAKAFCGSLAESLEKCDSGIDRAQCIETTKVYSDETIAKAKKCTTKSCSMIMDCVNATL